MLVLSRQCEEDIVIVPPGCEPITIRVVDIRGDKVRLGIVAQKDVPVHRGEVWDAINKAKGKAGQ